MNSSRRRSFLIPCAAIAWMLSTLGGALRAVEVDFNSSSDLNAFNRRNEFQWLPIQWTGSGGVGNSGALAVSRPHDTTYTGETFSLPTTNSKLVVSSKFKTRDPGTVGSGSAFGYGEVYLSEGAAGWNSDVASVSLDEISTGFRLWGGIIPAGGGGFSGFSPSFGPDIILPNRWYELKVEYTRLSNFQLGWDIEVNDFGADGTTFQGTAISSTHTTNDSLGFLNDATLYAGFTASQGATALVDDFFAGVPQAGNTQTVVLAPSVDVQVTPGTVFSLEEGRDVLTIDGGFGTSFPVKSALLEFPLTGIPAAAEILNATLTLTPTSSSGGMQIVVDGYEGDGLASTADVGASATQLAVSPVLDAGGDVILNLDPAYIESLLGSDSHLGLRLKSLNVGPVLSFQALEHVLGEAARLSIEYSLPPGPGDFDGNGVVDGADLAKWKSDFRLNANSDANADGATNGADFLIWQRQLGLTSPADATVAALPEPSCACLLLSAAAFSASRRPRRRQLSAS